MVSKEQFIDALTEALPNTMIDNIECIHNYIGVLKMINNRGSAADWSSGRWLPAG